MADEFCLRSRELIEFVYSMRRVSTLVALAALTPIAHAAAKPSSAAIRRAYETNRASIVEVVGPKKSGTGVIVGASGQVLTSVDYVGLNEATVRFEGRDWPAQVAVADAQLKIALVVIASTDRFPSTPVKLQATLEPGSWLVALSRRRGGRPAVSVGRVSSAPPHLPFAEIEISLAPGSPVFDERGRLVGVAVGQRKGHSSVLPVSYIHAQLKPLHQP